VSAHRERVREAEQLRLEVEEIERAAPLEGEDEEVRARLERLGNMESLRAASVQARSMLSDASDDPFARDAVSLIAAALAELESGPADPELGRIHEMLGSVQ